MHVVITIMENNDASDDYRMLCMRPVCDVISYQTQQIVTNGNWTQLITHTEALRSRVSLTQQALVRARLLHITNGLDHWIQLNPSKVIA